MHRLAPLVLCLALAACKSLSDPDSDYVTVHVDALATVQVHEGFSEFPFSEGQVVFEARKAGGEHESVSGSPDADGRIGPLRATFKVYREQPVDLNLIVLGGFLGFDLDQLPWSRIEDLMGKEYYWVPNVRYALVRAR